MTGAPPWMDAKACRPEHADLFFGGAEEQVRALAICSTCPVLDQCRADAEYHGDVVEGYTTHGQVVGGCAPPVVARPSRAVPLRRLCALPACREWFVATGAGSNLYCCSEHSAEGRRVNRQRRRAS